METPRPQHHRSTDVIHDRSNRTKKVGGERRIPEQLRSFDVVLQQPDQVLFSGDTVQGRVLVQLDGCLTVQAITVRLVGEAYVNVPEESGQWDHVRKVARIRHNLRRNKISPSRGSDCSGSAAGTPGEGRISPTCCRRWAKTGRPAAGPRHQPPAKFRSYEKYFDHKVFVFGHKYSSRREQLWAGSHAFPFDYALPTKLPASFHGRFGYVRYFCEATLERCASPAFCSRAYFSVGCVADINTDPKAESGASEQRSTNSCLFCCHKGTVMVSANIRRRGYVPGEDIYVSADVLNMSNRQVRRTCACLRQVVTYFSSKGFRNHVSEGKVSEVQRGPVPSGESDTWQHERLPVPAVPPTSKFTNCCKLMDIEYHLDFVVELVGDSEPLVLQLPLLVGSVPLQKHFAELILARDLAEYTQLQELPANVQTKYPDLPGAVSEPCVWGPRAVDSYFYKQLGRAKDQATLVVSGIRPHPRDVVFAPRYVCYLPRVSHLPFPDFLARRSVVELPQIVVTKPVAGACVKHNHDKTPLTRRHSAPGHLVACPSPITPLPGLKE